MERTEIPRDPEAIQKERENWSFYASGWRGYDEEGKRFKYTSILEDWAEVNGCPEDD